MDADKRTPEQTRTQDGSWVARLDFKALQERLPLLWPAPADTPACPKKRFRSHYAYPGWDSLRDPAVWETISFFELLLGLIDFNPLRAVLAQLLGWHNDRGWIAFDPVSIFLLKLWQLSNNWSRSQVVVALKMPKYAELVQQLGFTHHLPTEGGLRYIETSLGWHSEADGEVIAVQGEEGEPQQVAVQRLNELIVQSVVLLQQAGLIDEEIWQRALLCPDGMLHHTASRLRCTSVNADCYETVPRTCAAKEKDKQGCDCDQLVCLEACRFATPRDRLARFVWYSGSNGPKDNPNRPKHEQPEKQPRGKGVYGYRSLSLQLSDLKHRFNLTLLTDFQPANQPELPFATAQLIQFPGYYPDMTVEWVAGDAAYGFEPFLHTIYHQLHARRLVDLRAHQTDANRSLWPIRGYDDKGRPICPFGYALTSFGFDAQHQRHKWVCEKICQKGMDPRVQLSDTSYPPPECPYQAAEHLHGKVLNVAEHFADGSIRLVRDVPVGSPTWKRFYHQARNASEARNSFHKSLGLKRLPVYGLLRGKTTVFLADVWRNLSTLARLIREATLAQAE